MNFQNFEGQKVKVVRLNIAYLQNVGKILLFQNAKRLFGYSASSAVTVSSLSQVWGKAHKLHCRVGKFGKKYKWKMNCAPNVVGARKQEPLIFLHSPSTTKMSAVK